MKHRLMIMSILLALQSFSQTDSISDNHKNFISILTNYQYGNISPSSDFVRGDNLIGKQLKHYQSISAKVLWQNPGYSDWQKVFHGPYYGLGLTLGDFYDPYEVGYPVSVFGIFSFPLLRLKKLEVYSEIDYGITGNWKYYDPNLNPKNLVIGAGFTFNASIGINAFYPITKNFDLTTGFSYNHFSNGGLKRPNLGGFNIFAPNIGVRYHFEERPNVRSIKAPTRLIQSNDLYLMGCSGIFQSAKNELDSTYYAMQGVSVLYFSQCTDALRLGFGTDVNYGYNITQLPQQYNNFSLGFILQPEIVIDKLTLIVGIGLYAINKDYSHFKKFYQRWGVRYDVYKNISVGLNLRAIDFTTAEYMEFNIGYRIRWYKNS